MRRCKKCKRLVRYVGGWHQNLYIHVPRSVSCTVYVWGEGTTEEIDEEDLPLDAS